MVVISVSLLTFSGGDRTDRTPRVVNVVSALHKPVASAAVIAMMLTWGLPAAAKNYYLDGQTGSDTYQGTSTDPFRSFKHATSMLAPGDKLIVASGRYTEPLIVSKSGTAQQPISIVGNGRPLIEAKGIAIRISGSYVEISGFEAHELGQEGSAIGVGKRNHHVRVADNIARDSGCAGIGSIQTDYLIVENNRVFGNSRQSPWQCSGISIYQAINFDHAEGTHNIIRRNIVYDNMNIVVDNKITNKITASNRPVQILFLGNPSRRKGLHDLIAALAMNPLRSLEWRMSVAGGGNDIGTFRELSRAAGLSDRISFTGWVDRSKTGALLDPADIVVLPSYAEGMAMSILEGMSYGLCIVCTPVGSLKEVIEDEVTGLVVQPGDIDQLSKALTRAVSDPALRVQLGSEAARVFASKFDAAHYPDRMGAIYHAALAATSAI